MANDTSTNPLQLDTPGAGVIWPCNAFVVNIEFMTYTSDTDVCIIKNRAGKVIWNGNGAADLETVRSGMVGWAHGGIILDTLTAGLVRIYIK